MFFTSFTIPIRQQELFTTIRRRDQAYSEAPSIYHHTALTQLAAAGRILPADPTPIPQQVNLSSMASTYRNTPSRVDPQPRDPGNGSGRPVRPRPPKPPQPRDGDYRYPSTNASNFGPYWAVVTAGQPSVRMGREPPRPKPRPPPWPRDPGNGRLSREAIGMNFDERRMRRMAEPQPRDPGV
nr:hypothetical protein B0A51_18357 [Rachicladosporium sp. CCFEE 5018]